LAQARGDVQKGNILQLLPTHHQLICILSFAQKIGQNYTSPFSLQKFLEVMLVLREVLGESGQLHRNGFTFLDYWV
jgi:hypothetical protein